MKPTCHVHMERHRLECMTRIEMKWRLIRELKKIFHDHKKDNSNKILIHYYVMINICILFLQSEQQGKETSTTEGSERTHDKYCWVCHRDGKEPSMNFY